MTTPAHAQFLALLSTINDESRRPPATKQAETGPHCMICTHSLVVAAASNDERSERMVAH